MRAIIGVLICLDLNLMCDFCHLFMFNFVNIYCNLVSLFCGQVLFRTRGTSLVWSCLTHVLHHSH